MSYTTVLGIPGGKSQPIILGECKNAHRGAMWIWTELAKKYIPNKESYVAVMLGGEDFFQLYKDDRLTDAEFYALISTYDRVLIPPELMETVAASLVDFTPGTENLEKQAALIREAKAKGFKAVCFDQMSVSGTLWRVKDPDADDADEDEGWRPFDLERDMGEGTEYWFLKTRKEMKDAWTQRHAKDS